MTGVWVIFDLINVASLMRYPPEAVFEARTLILGPGPCGATGAAANSRRHKAGARPEPERSPIADNKRPSAAILRRAGPVMI